MSIPATRVVWVLWSGAILVAAWPLEAQIPVASDSLRQAIQALSARLDSLEAGRCPLGAAPALPGGTDSAAAALRELGARLEQVMAARCARAPLAPRNSCSTCSLCRRSRERRSCILRSS